MQSSSTIYEHLFGDRRKEGLLILLDPDRLAINRVVQLIKQIKGNKKVKGILVGTSLLLARNFDHFIKEIKKQLELPLLIFPGSSLQISPHADAILLLSLISGRNPELLIGEHVKAAPLLKQYGIEVISTAYLLIDGGNYTSVEFMSNTKPLPRNKIDIALAHTWAAEYLGFKLIYLEAGSGAEYPVPCEMIREISKNTSLPIMVGGGFKEKKQITAALASGANYVVIGNALEKNSKFLPGV